VGGGGRKKRGLQFVPKHPFPLLFVTRKGKKNGKMQRKEGREGGLRVAALPPL